MAQVSSSSTSAERGGGRARGDSGEVGGGRSSRRGKRGLIAGPTSSLVQRPVLFGVLARRHPRLCHRPAVMFALVATAHASTATVPTGEQPAPSPSGTEPPSCFSPLAPSSQRRGSEKKSMWGMSSSCNKNMVGGAQSICRALTRRCGRYGRGRVHLRWWVVAVLRRPLDGMGRATPTTVRAWGHKSRSWVQSAAAACCPPGVPHHLKTLRRLTRSAANLLPLLTTENPGP